MTILSALLQINFLFVNDKYEFLVTFTNSYKSKLLDIWHSALSVIHFVRPCSMVHFGNIYLLDTWYQIFLLRVMFVDYFHTVVDFHWLLAHWQLCILVDDNVNFIHNCK